MRDAEDYIISMAAKSEDEAQAPNVMTHRHPVRHEFWTRFLAREYGGVLCMEQSSSKPPTIGCILLRVTRVVADRVEKLGPVPQR
jgi:hypothetical protein